MNRSISRIITTAVVLASLAGFATPARADPTTVQWRNGRVNVYNGGYGTWPNGNQYTYPGQTYPGQTTQYYQYQNTYPYQNSRYYQVQPYGNQYQNSQYYQYQPYQYQNSQYQPYSGRTYYDQRNWTREQRREWRRNHQYYRTR